MRYLVTGGAGFIGSNIVEEFVKQGESVRVLDNFSTGSRKNLKGLIDYIELIDGDIRSYHIVQKAVKDMDIILHQAALVSVPRSIKDPITTNEVNVLGTLNLLNAARDASVKRFIYASSSSVYGDSEKQPKVEIMNPRPISPYAVSKLAGEKYCQVFHRVYGLETVCMRYFNVFGPRQNPDSRYAAVIPLFVDALRNNQAPVIFGDGEQSRSFTYVLNVVNANLLACNAESVAGSVFNIASEESYTINELMDSLRKIFRCRIEPIYDVPRKGDIRNSQADIRAARQFLNYEPRINFECGIRKTVEWICRKHTT